jgi:hypothetical protein
MRAKAARADRSTLWVRALDQNDAAELRPSSSQLP